MHFGRIFENVRIFDIFLEEDCIFIFFLKIKVVSKFIMVIQIKKFGHYLKSTSFNHRLTVQKFLNFIFWNA